MFGVSATPRFFLNTHKKREGRLELTAPYPKGLLLSFVNGRERAAPAQLTHVRSRERTSLDSLSAEFVVSKLTQRDLLDNKVGVFLFLFTKRRI